MQLPRCCGATAGTLCILLATCINLGSQISLPVTHLTGIVGSKLSVLEESQDWNPPKCFRFQNFVQMVQASGSWWRRQTMSIVNYLLPTTGLHSLNTEELVMKTETKTIILLCSAVVIALLFSKTSSTTFQDWYQNILLIFILCQTVLNGEKEE